MVLHVGDATLLERQNLRPFMWTAVTVGPRECDGYTVVHLLDRVDGQALVAIVMSPAKRGLENLTGLVRPVSGGNRSPEAPAPSPTAPFHLGSHQRDKRLDIPFTKREVRGTNLVDAHGFHGTPRLPRGNTPRDNGMQRGWPAPPRRNIFGLFGP
jgi:hypothetical protein